MKTDFVNKPRVWLVTACLLAAGCATKGASEASPESVVSERAQQRWTALLAGDVERAYAFLSPGERSALSLVDYSVQVQRSRVRWVAAEVRSVACEAMSCSVEVGVQSTVVSPMRGVKTFDLRSFVTENWIWSNGEWWFVPK
jgi:hypothetical protein